MGKRYLILNFGKNGNYSVDRVCIERTDDISDYNGVNDEGVKTILNFNDDILVIDLKENQSMSSIDSTWKQIENI